MKKSTKEQLGNFSKKKSVIGLQLIIIGILGIFLPIIPGILLAIIGIGLIFPKLKKQLYSNKE